MDIKLRNILPKPGSTESLHGPSVPPRRPRHTSTQQKTKAPLLSSNTIPKVKEVIEVASTDFEALKRYYFPAQEYLSYEKLASVLDPSPNSAPSLWRRVFDRRAELAVFYQLDYAADVPRVSKCIRIRKERNSSLQYVLVPTVYLHGQELSDSYVSAILGSAVLRKFEDVTRLLESLDTTGVEEDAEMEYSQMEDFNLAAETLPLQSEADKAEVDKLGSMFATSSTEPSSLFALQSQFTATPIRTLAPKPSISYVPVINDPDGLAQFRRARKAEPSPTTSRVLSPKRTPGGVRCTELSESEESPLLVERSVEDDEEDDEEASIPEDEGSSMSSVREKPRKRFARTKPSKKVRAILDKDKPKQDHKRRKRCDIPVRGPPARGQILSTAFGSGSDKAFGLYGFLKQPTGPVPPECVELHNTTAPWFFAVPAVGKIILHEQYPRILIGEQALVTLQQQSRSSDMYKWFIFIQLLGGERGLFRLSSIWTNDRNGQMMEVLGKDTIFALDQHVVQAVKAGIVPLPKRVTLKNSATTHFLSGRFASWRRVNSKAINAENASPAPKEIVSRTSASDERQDTVFAV